MSTRAEKAKKWGKWAGLVAFLFFLVKGLLWVGLLAGAWWVVTGER